MKLHILNKKIMGTKLLIFINRVLYMCLKKVIKIFLIYQEKDKFERRVHNNLYKRIKLFIISSRHK
jgi:hypothetical protein